MKKERLIAKTEVNAAFRRRLLMVCFLFAMGAFCGLLTQSVLPAQEHEQLQLYLLRFAQVFSADEDPVASVVSVLVVYFRYPLLLFLCGFFAAGLVFAPLVCLLQGFFLAFSVCCFASALGRAGVILALAAFGVRCLVTLPCTFCLAAQSMGRSFRKMQAGKQAEKLRAEENVTVLLYFLYLLLGVAAEFAVVPKLLQLALAGIS